MSDHKIINDPVFGFIKVPHGLLLNIIKHPIFQRLNRIKQLGLANVVYPGAQHTRFQHSIGAFHLMSEAIISLRQKGHFIFDSEAEAVEAAILMHDIGHGPFSHVLENTLISGVDHEEISLMLMERMNDDFNGALTLAINIFRDNYHKRFLHQLISSQLDMDRLDYIRRDSFFTGVTEGNIGSARIIKMLNVVDDHLVVEKKGIYSIENFLVTRRLMYWQVYLHKTTVACEKMLVNVLRRAKHLAHEGKELFCSPALHYFLYNNINKQQFESDDKCLENYIKLDDNDIWCALKVWTESDDIVLRILSRNIMERRIFKVEVSSSEVSPERIAKVKEAIAKKYSIDTETADYFISVNTVGKNMYSTLDDSIEILFSDGTTCDVSEASDMLNVQTLSRTVCKYYFCYERDAYTEPAKE